MRETLIGVNASWPAMIAAAALLPSVLTGGLACPGTAARQEARMDPFEKVRKQSRYQWAGKTAARGMRFHHLVRAPEVLAGTPYRVAGTSRQLAPEFALDWQLWSVAPAGSDIVVLQPHLREYGALAATHEALLRSLNSISRPGLDYSPLAGGPGDVYVLDKMCRDNLLVTGAAADPEEMNRVEPVLRAIDRWLLDDWPLIVARRSHARGKLGVVLRSRVASARVGEAVQLEIRVHRDEVALNLSQLPHRIAVEPGTIERRGDEISVTPSERGRVTVSASVLGLQGEHGVASLTLDVQ